MDILFEQAADIGTAALWTVLHVSEEHGPELKTFKPVN
jgi:hypothetical protein